MEFTTSPTRPHRSRTHSESTEVEEVPQALWRRAARVQTYAESDDDDDDNINVGSGALLGEVDSEVEEAVIRCICGATEEDDDGREYIQCDSCDVWQHMDCLNIPSATAQATPNFMCDQCSPYGAIGAAMSVSEQPGLPVRRASQNTTSTTSRRKGEKLDVLSYYKSIPELSVKKSAKRVSFSPLARPPSSSEDDNPDEYIPSDEEVSNRDEEEDYPSELEEEHSTLFVSRTSTPETPSGGAKLAKHPRPPGTSDMSDRIVRKWIAGEYAADIDAENAAVEWGSDVSEVDIPDMSEGADLLAKLAEQDKLIFGLKKRLEQRGERIMRLKQQVLDLERENWMLKGIE